LPPQSCTAILDPIEAVEQLPEAVVSIGFDAESRQGTQKTRHRLGTELAPDFCGEPFSLFSLVAGHHFKSCVGSETPAVGEWFPHHASVASQAGKYSKL
jgi:hypothetical protein